MSVFEVGQIWRRIEAPAALFLVARVDKDSHDIAVCHHASVSVDEVHPSDVVLISATESDLARWELAHWSQVAL